MLQVCVRINWIQSLFVCPKCSWLHKTSLQNTKIAFSRNYKVSGPNKEQQLQLVLLWISVLSQKGVIGSNFWQTCFCRARRSPRGEGEQHSRVQLEL